MLVMGCGASAREKTLRATFVTVNAARDGFTAFDVQHQQQIVADAKTLEAGAAALAAYRQDRERVLALFEGVYHVLAAATFTDDVKTVATLVELAENLQKALDDLKKAATPPPKVTP